MSEDVKKYDDEIDLLEIFNVLWDGKWKIIAITFIFAIVGVSFSTLKPNSYYVSAALNPAKNSVFIEYIPLNKLLESNEVPYSIDADTIIQKIVSEFNDYDEMISVLASDSIIQQSVNELSERDKRRALIGRAKSFIVSAPSAKKTDGKISFSWHDVDEGDALLNSAMSSVVLNVKKENVETLTRMLDIAVVNKLREMEVQKSKLKELLEQEAIEVVRRIIMLSEHSAIAKELGIEKNQLNAKFTTVTINSDDSYNSEEMFYLRGYKAIDKEITLLKSRSDEQLVMFAKEYPKIKSSILVLEEELNLLPKLIQKNIDLLSKGEVNDWVDFDLSLAEVKSNKKSMLYVAVSILLGGMIGVFYVLIANVVRTRKLEIAIS
jgi:LPS O-antigen subunit length determinant protein (WzzB/FepE family)